MANEVKYQIKLLVDGKEKVVDLSDAVGSLGLNLEDAGEKATGMRDSMLQLSSLINVLDSLSMCVRDLTGVFDELTGAYTEQIEAETKLANNMRNTMGASDEMVDSIKALCSAQQELGVIGDEVQLAGAQELATYLEKKESLEQLIPVMNDMLAQQYGLNASSESAAQIASMLGKVMDGQTEALSRYGYKFDEAQASVLKFGDESARAATLASVVEASVGGMNAALANTDAGKAKQLSNTMGDLKEKIGGLLMPLQEGVMKFGQFALAVNGIVTLCQSVKGLGAALSSVTVVQKLWTFAKTIDTGVMTALGLATRGTTLAVKGLKLAIRGLLISTGVGAILVGITAALEALIGAFSDAGDEASDFGGKMEELEQRASNAEEAMAQTEAQTFGEMMTKFNELKVQWSALKDDLSRNEFVRDHASDWDFFKEKIDNATDAEEFFNRGTDKIVEAFKRRAKWAGIAAHMMQLYSELREIDDDIASEQQSHQQNVRNSVTPAKAGQEVSTATINRYGLLSGVHYNDDVDLGNEDVVMAGGGHAVFKLTGPGAEYLTQREREDAVRRRPKSLKTYALEQRRKTVLQQLKTDEEEMKKVAEEEGDYIRSRHGGRGGHGGGRGGHGGGRGGHGGGGGNSNNSQNTELKLIANPQNDPDYRNNINYWQKQADVTGQPAEKYEEVASKLKAAKEAYEKYLQGRKDKEIVSAPSSEEDWENNLKILEDLRDVTEDPEKWRALGAEINNTRKEYLKWLRSQSGEPESMSDFDDMLQLARGELDLATSQDDVRALEGVIREYESGRQKLEDASVWSENAAAASALDSQTKSFDMLDARIAFHTKMLGQCDSESRAWHHSELNRLREMRASWEDALETVETDASKLSTLDEIDRALEKLTSRQQKESGEAVMHTQEEIEKLEKKRRLLELMTEIPGMQRELHETASLPKSELMVEVKAIGIEGLEAKIRELKKLLDDTDNPVGETMRKSIEDMIGTYEEWRRMLVRSFDTYRAGWDSVKGIVGGIESISSALGDNANAWQRVTGMVDGALSIYDGVKGVIEIIDLLKSVVVAETAAETANTVAKEVGVGADLASAGSKEGAALAAVPAIAAYKLETAAVMELASAKYMEAHAGMPVVGLGLGIGYSSSAIAFVQSVGAMPFAKGGVVSGPTMALVGEYAGAVNNPEVIAPLDKLRDLLRVSEDGVPEVVEFRIKDRVLEGLLKKRSRFNSRT